MAGKVLTVVKRRPGGNTPLIQKFLRLDPHEDISVLDAFDQVVVPALEQKKLLRGRDWGSLLQAEIVLKHDANQGLIDVDQVCLRPRHRLALCTARPLIFPSPRAPH